MSELAPLHGCCAGASDKKLLVAFSAGPYGAALNDGSEYDGSYASRVSEEQIMDFHAKRLHVSLSISPACGRSCSEHAEFEC